MSESKRMKMMQIVSSDNQNFTIEHSVVMISEVFSDMIESCNTASVKLEKIDGATLAKVLEYCKMRTQGGENSDADCKKFINDIGDHKILIALLIAADFLQLECLMDLVSQALAKMIDNKTVEEICELFGIELPPIEVRKQIETNHPWAFGKKSPQ